MRDLIEQRGQNLRSIGALSNKILGIFFQTPVYTLRITAHSPPRVSNAKNQLARCKIYLPRQSVIILQKIKHSQNTIIFIAITLSIYCKCYFKSNTENILSMVSYCANTLHLFQILRLLLHHKFWYWKVAAIDVDFQLARPTG